jgi:hypothetical protein
MREAKMEVIQDRRLWYVVAAAVIVVIALAMWPRSKTEVLPSPAATSAPATPPAAPATPAPEAPAKQ